ncbi:hypothetical protein QTO34_005617 [Cnephaeus nilssonii]|uniref:Uncharacterized protein n=1 Tax=Cnephaeus nilssonii TaxID=3371016 RepID=A0AA40HPI5_CNENI|nr:hypothetical protein QTO34_005617 [Eptesicus nilssonii]
MSRLHKPRALKPLSPDTRRAILKYVSELYGPLNDTRPEDQEPKEAEPKGEQHQPRRQRQLLLSHRKSILRRRMQSWRHLHLQSFHHLQQPLQLQLWSQGRPQTKPRPHHSWRKNPPWSPCWFLPQRRSCLWRAQLKGPLLNVLTLS